MAIDKLLFLLSTIRITDILDILIVSYAFYRIFILINGTRATQVIKGILFVFIFAKLSGFLKLYTINWILNNAVTFGVFAGIVVFQPELRRILEYIGNNNLLKASKNIDTNKNYIAMNEIIKASFALAEKKIGALIVLEKKTGLKDIVETGICLNSEVSYELLMNIFIPNTPLHDGAVIVRGASILAASCFLPLTDNNKISMELGTRHRAALGISEKSDCVVIVVSEETGFVSLCERGIITRDISKEDLLKYLIENFVSLSNQSSFKDIIQNMLGKIVDSMDTKQSQSIKDEIKKEVREEILDDIKHDIKNDIRDNFDANAEDKGDNVGKKKL